MHNNIACPLVWNHQFIDGTGRVKPCCRFQGSIGKLEKNLDSTFYSQEMSIVRKEMLSGNRPEGCKRCWQEEDSGKKSLRQRYKSHPDLGQINFDKPSIEWLELAISNDCNLACRMCDSRYSHKLYDEEIEFYGQSFSKNKRTKIDIESIFPHVSTLKHLKITGGEPLITPDHWKLLDYIIDNDHAHRIYLNYSTNCTVYPKQEMVDRWKKFKYVEIAISLDSIKKEENEYLRYGTDQETVIKNIEKFSKLRTEFDLRLIARPTVTILNIYHLPETLEWLDSKNIKHNATHLSSPSHLSITVLPNELKEQISEKFDNYVYKFISTKESCKHIKNYMNSKDDSILFETFIKHTNYLDGKRNQDFKKTYPYFDF